MPCYLELEVTESLGTHDKDYVINTMNKLKALGLALSIEIEPIIPRWAA